MQTAGWMEVCWLVLLWEKRRMEAREAQAGRTARWASAEEETRGCRIETVEKLSC